MYKVESQVPKPSRSLMVILAAFVDTPSSHDAMATFAIVTHSNH